jgi:CMP-N-acetylneuraminic acid synthetase
LKYLEKKILAIIPARGGSKGIPRKNVRPLNNKPLLYYSIHTLLSSKFNPDIYVTSEDEEILSLAKCFGAGIVRRDLSLSEDEVTLDIVIYNAFQEVQKRKNTSYDLVITIQPTSPLLKVESLDQAIEQIFSNPSIDTIISAKKDTHLSWRKENGNYIPNFEKRMNRQYLTPQYKETGAFLITRPNLVTPENRIGKNVELFELTGAEAIDIDNYDDWSLCEYYIQRKTILFVVTGNNKVGLGHVYRTLQLAHAILDHKVLFLVDKNSSVAYNLVSKNNYEVYKQENLTLAQHIIDINPDIVINDILDTSYDYINTLKQHKLPIINFEDLGEGASSADIVINALYKEKNIKYNHYFGHQYFLPRDEFYYQKTKEVKTRVEEVLITYGGADPNNLTLKTLQAINAYCKKKSIKITIILGIGYNKELDFTDEQIHVLKNVKNISEYMLKADIIFSSAGRTVYEIACIGTPAIVMAQNERETTHFFANPENGFINLGLGAIISLDNIEKTFVEYCENPENRKYANHLMLSKNVKSGKDRVIKLIKEYINKDKSEHAKF